MKSGEVARKYGFSEYDVNKYIKDNADFTIKENLWGDIIIPDNIDIEFFFNNYLWKKN